MLHPAQTVTTQLTLAVSASTGDAELLAELRYDPSDPLAVSLAIGLECSEPVVWVFGRDLLSEGVSHPTGEGDITIEPAGDARERLIRITLATHSMATMVTSRDAIVEFLIVAFTQVPTGCEMDRFDMDAEIEALLNAELT